MKFLSVMALIFSSHSLFANCEKPLDLLVIGDSQVGATWSKSYTGNFLQECLQGEFVVYGRGGTVPGNWFANGGMDQIETIQRDPQNNQLNLGAKENVPLCKRRLEPMLTNHNPKKVLFSFGGNYIGESINKERVLLETKKLIELVEKNAIAPSNCFYLTPTFEMAVASKRNVPHRDLQGSLTIRDLVASVIKDKCTLLDGVELMRESAYFDGKEFLKRVLIPGKGGCSGASENDNVHICGEAARDMAEKVCAIVN